MAAPRKTAAKKTVAPQPSSPPEIADVSSWKKPAEPTMLPSGKWVVIRRVGMKAFILNGTIPNSLMSIVQGALETGVGPKDEELMKEMLGDPEKLAEFIGMLDAAVVNAMVNPRVYPTPLDESERDDDRLYADEIDEADKMAIFQVAVGGTVDLEQFRQ